MKVKHLNIFNTNKKAFIPLIAIIIIYLFVGVIFGITHFVTNQKMPNMNKSENLVASISHIFIYPYFLFTSGLCNYGGKCK